MVPTMSENEPTPRRQPSAARVAAERRSERVSRAVLQEGVTMALYLAIVLYASIVALPDQDRLEPLPSTGLIWGTTIGLTLAHQFAFSVSAPMVAGHGRGRRERQMLAAQGLAAIGVAALVSLPVIFLSVDAGYEAAEAVLTAIIGVAAFASSRRAGASLGRALLLTGVLLAVAAGIVAIKVAAGH
jgi:hypothetical protein